MQRLDHSMLCAAHAVNVIAATANAVPPFVGNSGCRVRGAMALIGGGGGLPSPG